jgi:hypothetical protein
MKISQTYKIRIDVVSEHCEYHFRFTIIQDVRPTEEEILKSLDIIPNQELEPYKGRDYLKDKVLKKRYLVTEGMAIDNRKAKP